MSPQISFTDRTRPIGEAFKALVNKVPESEEEAEYIIGKIEKMLLKHPSLSQYLKSNEKEQKELSSLRELLKESLKYF